VCSALIRSKTEYASTDCNLIMITDSYDLEGIQRKIAALYHTRFIMAFVTINMKIS
jgi:hypothetical protein